MNPTHPLALDSSGIGTTEFLVVLALMLIMMVAGLAALMHKRSDPSTGFPALDKLAELLVSKDPKQRQLLLRYLVGAANAIAGVAALNFGVSEGVIDGDGCKSLTATALGIVGVFYVIMRSGLNRHLADPSMSFPQIACAIVYLAWGYVLGGPGGPVSLLLLFAFLMFSMFTSTTRQLIHACAIAIVAFGSAMLHVAQSPQQAPYMGKLQLVYFCVLLLVLVSVCLMVAQLNRIRSTSTKRKRELAEALSRIQDLAMRDDLTGLFNRRHMLELLNTEKHRCIRNDRRFCVALIDVDHFKAVNDTHGHGVGDEVLASLANVMSSAVRETDVVGRWGGEEFLIMFTDTDCPTAELVLSRLQMMLAAASASPSVPGLHVTFSAGLTRYEPEEMLTRTIDRADRALYLAKAGGRDRVIRLEPGQHIDGIPGSGPSNAPPPDARSTPLENRHAFDMSGMGKHVHGPA